MRLGFRLALNLVIAVMAVGLVACTSPSELESPPWIFTPSAEWDVILATRDLAQGERRFAFSIIGTQGIVRIPAVIVRASNQSTTHTSEAIATFFPFPETERGIYSTTLLFATTGEWDAEVFIPDFGKETSIGTISFSIAEEPIAIGIGDQAPKTVHPTLADVPDVSHLTTGSQYDEALYQTTIRQALEQGLPLTVVFASPAFCTNPICGPQVETISKLRQKYGTEMQFVHLDIYANPHEIQGDLTRAVRNSALNSWRITADEWTFVIDAQGKVVASFENYAPESELEKTIKQVLQSATLQG